MFALNGPGGCISLAMQVIEVAEKNHDHAVDMAISVREAIITMAIAMALVTQVQNSERPIIAISEEAPPANPAELLEILASGYLDAEGEWEKLVEEFLKFVNNRNAEKEIKEMPDTLFVEDILGKGK